MSLPRVERFKAAAGSLERGGGMGLPPADRWCLIAA
jgi:hypothetical protein